MYAEVILPLSLADSYTYKIPSDLENAVAPGCRVIVHFGQKRYYTALVMEVHDRKPATTFETKEIYVLLDATPVVRRPQIRFWEWLSSYYLCKMGDVYKAALPSGLKLESETVVSCNKEFEAPEPLKKNEQQILDAFYDKDKLTVSELEKITGIRNVVPVLATLMIRGAVEVSEEIKRGFAPKKQTFIQLPESLRHEEKLQQIFDELKRAKKQELLLISYLDLSHAMNPQLYKEISRKELLEHSGCNAAVLDGLIKRGVLESYEKEVSRLRSSRSRIHPLSPLTPAQEQAYDEIHEAFKSHEVCLLHGVTSSGKTEIYAYLIEEVLKKGRSVLYLLPEIAITTQITDRLARMFGDKLLVYHSRFSDNERVEVWNTLLYADEPKLILGVRSSLFLPFKDLGLIIVDEEHETSYKQQDPSPRYHARNAAMVLAQMHGGKTLLGSATPSIDSYFNALTGKYGWVRLTTRYGNCRMPEVIPVDMKELKRKKIVKDSLFSPVLIDKIEQALNRKEQVILFQNRRGFAPFIECKSCGSVPHCINCDVSLTYHKYHQQLVCHYCGYTYPLPQKCPECAATEMKMVGFGTEKVEEEISALFPETQVERLDMDSVRTRASYERIIENFEKGKTHILIGTQMISKGLDFSNVAVVGILNADSMMNFPDFRAHERAYQLMEQVSGRAGRREKQGLVVIQTYQPDHPLIQMVCRFAYDEMVKWQLTERSMFRYPPYYRLIEVVLRSRRPEALKEMSDVYATKLREKLGERVLGPVTPPITRIQTLHIKKIVMKIEAGAAIAPVRKLLENIHEEMQDYPLFKQILLHYDVDPV